MKKQPLTTLLVMLAAAVLVFGVAKNVIAKAAIESGVRLITGLRLSIDRMDVGLRRSAVGIRGLKLYNPAGFPDPVMADLPEIFVDYDLGAFLGGKVHLEEVRLNLQEFVVVRDRGGKLNLDALNVVKQSKETKKDKAAAAKQTAAPSMRIDALELHIGTVIYKDYTAGGSPRVQKFPVNIHERYQNITNPYVLGGLVVSRALMQTSIARLANFELGDLQSLAHTQLQHAERLMGDAVNAAQVIREEAVKQLKDPSQLTGTVKSTAEGVANSGKEALGTATGAATGVLKKLLPPGTDDARQ